MAEKTRQVYHYGDILETLNNQIGPIGCAHIAGGAVRDTLMGREIKDIDIFLDSYNADQAASLLRFHHGYVKVGEWERYERFSDPAVDRVAKFEKADETIPICLIGLKSFDPEDIQSNLRRFDFGICMAAWDGKDIIKDVRFTKDIDAKTFTLCRADTKEQFAYSMVRYKKLTADRYKNWALEVLPEFEELAKEHTFRKIWYRDYDTGHFGYHTHQQVLRPKERPEISA